MNEAFPGELAGRKIDPLYGASAAELLEMGKNAEIYDKFTETIDELIFSSEQYEDKKVLRSMALGGLTEVDVAILRLAPPDSALYEEKRQWNLRESGLWLATRATDLSQHKTYDLMRLSNSLRQYGPSYYGLHFDQSTRPTGTVEERRALDGEGYSVQPRLLSDVDTLLAGHDTLSFGEPEKGRIEEGDKVLLKIQKRFDRFENNLAYRGDNRGNPYALEAMKNILGFQE